MELLSSSTGPVGIILTKGNDQTIQLNIASAEFDAPEGLKRITISSGLGELENLNTRDFAVDGTDDHQIAVDFSQNVAAQGSYSTLAVSPGSYFTSGITQTQDGSALKIVATFDGASDPAYLGATSPELTMMYLVRLELGKELLLHIVEWYGRR